jgi:uncharacterized protein
MTRSRPQAGGKSGSPRTTRRDFIEIGAAFAVLFGAFLVLKQLDILPRFALTDSVNYGLVFLIGLTASVSTCIAVTGGLLVAVAAKYNETVRATGAQKLKPHIYFNLGRIISYTALGAAIGTLGSALALPAEINGLLMLAASAAMIVLGLQMLRLIPSFGVLRSLLPQSVRSRLQEFSERNAHGGAFLLGASTFFLPCGFTQALQLYVLAKGDAYAGALTMLIFSLGTLPALFSLSAISSFARGNFQRYFLKLAGVAVVLLGLINIEYGLALTGWGSSPVSIAELTRSKIKASEERVQIMGGKQVAEMKIVGLSYEPNHFTVAQGTPVVWRINAEEAEGCGRILIVPKLRIRTYLQPQATNVITFTPDQPGEIEFNCGMGMMTPNSKFTVVSKSGE